MVLSGDRNSSSVTLCNKLYMPHISQFLNGFVKQIVNGLAVYTHQIGNLTVVQMLVVFQINDLLLFFRQESQSVF